MGGLGLGLGLVGGPGVAAAQDDSPAEGRATLWIGSPVATPTGTSAASLGPAPTSFRFLATESGCVRNLHVRWRFREPERRQALYREGDGGRYRIGFHADDGTGAPDADALEALDYVPVVADDVGAPEGESAVKLDFEGRACLRAGSRYHVVFENRHPDPERAKIAFTGPVLDGAGEDEAWPCPRCLRTDVLVEDVAGRWGPYREENESVRVRMPNWCVGLDDGVALGQPVQYGYGVLDVPAAVYGAFRVRQRLVPAVDLPGPLELAFYARRVVGDAPLAVSVGGRDPVPVTLDGPAGGPAGTKVRDGRAFDWVTMRVEAGLEAGRDVAVTFATGPESAYELAAGVHAIGACGAAITGDAGGPAERSDDAGASWAGFSVFGQGDRSNVRLALYFRTVPAR